MHWLLLIGAIVFEVIGTTGMKMSDGFKKWGPSLVMIVCYPICFALLAFALKKIDVSIAYAIWSGVGTSLIAAIGIIYFREPVTMLKIGSLALIIIGVVGLNLSGSGH